MPAALLEGAGVTRLRAIPVVVVGAALVVFLTTRALASGPEGIEAISLKSDIPWMEVELQSAGAYELSGDELRDVLLTAGWHPSHLQAAARVAGCESGWHPEAVGHAGELGLFQIHKVHLQAGGPDEQRLLMDPLVNARVALLIWQQQGWEPWSCGWAATAGGPENR